MRVDGRLTRGLLQVPSRIPATATLFEGPIPLLLVSPVPKPHFGRTGANMVSTRPHPPDTTVIIELCFQPLFLSRLVLVSSILYIIVIRLPVSCILELDRFQPSTILSRLSYLTVKLCHSISLRTSPPRHPIGAALLPTPNSAFIFRHSHSTEVYSTTHGRASTGF